MTQAPEIPTVVRHSWFPATVTLPDGTVHRVAKVFATDAGLRVYTRGVSPAGLAPDPAFTSAIHYDKTAPPPTGYPARQKAARIETDAGTVTVRPLPGCGCAYRALKNWTPQWARRIEPWSATR